jgi:hypothetical protein
MSSSIQPGNGYGFTSSGYGVSLNISNPFLSEDGPYDPLDPSLSVDKVSVTPGTVNRYVPKIATTYLDDPTPPTITVTGEGYVSVKCTYEANKFFPRTAEIVFTSGATVPVDTNTESYYPIAKVNSTTVGMVTTLSLVRLVTSGNLAVNRLKAGASTATWWWTRV